MISKIHLTDMTFAIENIYLKINKNDYIHDIVHRKKDKRNKTSFKNIPLLSESRLFYCTHEP